MKSYLEAYPSVLIIEFQSSNTRKAVEELSDSRSINILVLSRD